MNTEIRKNYSPFGDVKGLAVFSGVFRKPATQSDLLHPLDDNSWVFDRLLINQLSKALCKELEPFPSLIINQTKRSIEDSPQTCLPSCLEKRQLESIGIVCIIEADDLWKALPHLKAIREGPY